MNQNEKQKIDAAKSNETQQKLQISETLHGMIDFQVNYSTMSD